MDRVDMEKWLWSHSYQQMTQSWWQRCECHPSYLPMKTYSYTVRDTYATRYKWNKGWNEEVILVYKDYEVVKGELICAEKS